MTNERLTPAERAIVETSLATLERLGEAVGAWTTKTTARRTGFTLHVKFDQQTDVFTSGELADVMTGAPGLLAVAYRRMLKTDDQLAELETGAR